MFFHEVPLHLFIDFLTNKGFEPVTHQEDETYTVVIPEKMNDDLYDKIEEKYEVLFAP